MCKTDKVVVYALSLGQNLGSGKDYVWHYGWLIFGQYNPLIDYQNPYLFQDMIGGWQGSTFLVWIGSMVHAFMWARGGQLGVIPGCSFSNHSPLKLKFFLSSTRRASRFRIPNSIFLREDCKDLVQTICSRYHYDVNVILLNVVHVLKEIQEFFLSKAKACTLIMIPRLEDISQL